MRGNCPFSPQLQGRKMEYELLELSFVSFSYCCVIFNVIDAGVSGHIFSLEIAFNIPPFKLFDYDSFLPLRNIFRSIPCQTASSELYSEHDNLAVSSPLALCEPCLRCAGQNGEGLSGLCRMKMGWSLLCIDQPALKRWANFLGSDWRSGAESRILVLSQCKWRAE